MNKGKLLPTYQCYYLFHYMTTVSVKYYQKKKKKVTKQLGLLTLDATKCVSEGTRE